MKSLSLDRLKLFGQLAKFAAARDKLEVQEIAANLHWQKRGAKVTHEPPSEAIIIEHSIGVGVCAV
jgi:hypothetical protein